MRIKILLVTLAFCVPATALAQGREVLAIRAPAAWGDWKQASDQVRPDGTTLTVWVPPDQDGSAWRDSVSVFTYESRPPGDATSAAIRTIIAQAQAACFSVSVVAQKPETLGPFSVGSAQTYCSQRKDAKRGRIDFMKAIASQRRVYLVVASRNVKPFRITGSGAFRLEEDEIETVDAWLKATDEYLKDVRVCTGPPEKRDLCSP